MVVRRRLPGCGCGNAEESGRGLPQSKTLRAVGSLRWFASTSRRVKITTHCMDDADETTAESGNIHAGDFSYKTLQNTARRYHGQNQDREILTTKHPKYAKGRTRRTRSSRISRGSWLKISPFREFADDYYGWVGSLRQIPRKAPEDWRSPRRFGRFEGVSLGCLVVLGASAAAGVGQNSSDSVFSGVSAKLHLEIQQLDGLTTFQRRRRRGGSPEERGGGGIRATVKTYHPAGDCYCFIHFVVRLV